jgi:ubiquinone/menaquinone biosynthesis C-methylase UbiE
MKYDAKQVKDIYDGIAAEEDKQEKGISLRVHIPRAFIKKYIKRTDIVLDAGGGTGINTLLMSKHAAQVTLLDISNKILAEAKKNIANTPYKKRITVLQGDILDLSRFKDKSFSFVVSVGDAVSYVLDKRFMAIKEIVRVAKKNAIIIIGCDSRYGFMRQYLNEGNIAEVINIYRTGDTTCGMGPKTHAYTIEEMTGILKKNNCEILEIASTPTITDAVIKKNAYTDWKKLKALELELCTKPELLGIGNHLLFVARKK